MRSGGDVVREFIEAYVRRDADAALQLVTDDVVFEHVPLPESTIVRGKEQLRQRIEGAVAAAERVEWEILRQVDGGDVVMNERVDVFHFPAGMFARTHTSTRVAGIFELRDGRIAAWRDYYDLKSGWLDQVGIDYDELARSFAPTRVISTAAPPARAPGAAGAPRRRRRRG